jgi:hypothetical protein
MTETEMDTQTTPATARVIIAKDRHGGWMVVAGDLMTRAEAATFPNVSEGDTLEQVVAAVTSWLTDHTQWEPAGEPQAIVNGVVLPVARKAGA